MCVCVCVCAHHTFMKTYIQFCYINLSMHTNIHHTCLPTSIHLYLHTDSCMYVYNLHIYMYRLMHVCLHTYMHTHTYMHAHINT